MTRTKLPKSLAFVMAMVLVLSTMFIGASAQTIQQSPRLIELAQLYGSHDLSSSEITTVIVELKEKSVVESKHMGKKQTEQNLAKVRKNIAKELQSKIKNAKVGREYSYLFSGMAVELPSNQIPQILTVKGIKAVYPNIQYTTTETKTIDQEFMPAMMNSAPYIGSQQAWDLGYTGKGITVAVIDTGVDYNHPDLAHAFGEYKGWDMVDNDNDPQETPAGDPRGEKTTHGTHVAGTIAANGEIMGVAPEATLLAYRVLGPGGSGTTTDVIAGIEKAVEDGADVMNLSLGNSLNHPDYATSIALDWAMAEGVVAVTSNGNAGPDNWTVGSPGTSRRAISVGATQLPYNVYGTSIFTSEGIEYTPAVMGFPNDKSILDLNGNTYEFVYVELGAPEDFVGKDLTGKIALIKRGAYAFVDKAQNAKDAGAIGAIIFNQNTGQIEHDIPGIAIPTIKLSNADGMKMLEELEAGKNQVTINTFYQSTVGEQVADFSSRGPVMESWMIKPDVCAPGVNIVSTIPGGYGAKQGTSMASPHVAGASALILQANPTWTVDEVKAALMNTAENLYTPKGYIYPHNTQGAGSIRIVEAINAKTLILPGSHSFGVFEKNNGKEVRGQHFIVKNLGNNTNKYSFEVEFAGNPKAIKLMTSSNTQVKAGESKNINFNVQVDTSKLDPGYYEGTIKVNDGTSVMEVPTILFIQEPDYPPVTHVYFDELADSNLITTYHPGGADYLEFWVYSEANEQPVEFLGWFGEYTDIQQYYNEFYWDGTLGGQKLAPDTYVLFAYSEKLDRFNYVGTLIEITK